MQIITIKGSIHKMLTSIFILLLVPS